MSKHAIFLIVLYGVIWSAMANAEVDEKHKYRYVVNEAPIKQVQTYIQNGVIKVIPAELNSEIDYYKLHEKRR